MEDSNPVSSIIALNFQLEATAELFISRAVALQPTLGTEGNWHLGTNWQLALAHNWQLGGNYLANGIRKVLERLKTSCSSSWRLTTVDLVTH